MKYLFRTNWSPKTCKKLGIRIKFGRWLTSSEKFIYCRLLYKGYKWTPFCIKYLRREGNIKIKRYKRNAGES